VKKKQCRRTSEQVHITLDIKLYISHHSNVLIAES